MSNVVNFKATLTPEESKINVDVSSDKITSFSKGNLETFNSFFNPDSAPKIYGSQSFVTYVSTMLINISDIEDDNNSETKNSQKVRVGINPEYDAIKSDITENGFDLTEKPIMVFKLPNGKYEIGEGRTRLMVLKALGMTNIIANVFAETSASNKIKFALMMNTTKKPFGAASVNDLLQAIKALISLGTIKSVKADANGIQSMTDAIEYELGIMAGGKLKPAQWNSIVFDALEDLTGAKLVSSFPNGAGTTEWLEENGYTNNRETMYVPVAEFLEKIAKKMVTLSKDYPNVKEFKLIIYKGTLKAGNPEKDWKESVLKFKNKYEDFEEKLSELRFNGADIDDSRFKIYGAIPQVLSLKKKYPMNRLVVYK